MPKSSLKGDLQARDRIIQEFYDVFDSIGCLPDEYTIHVDWTIPQVAHPPRRIPIAIKEKFKTELGALVNQGIISQVTEPTPWVNSFVCVTKANTSVGLY